MDRPLKAAAGFIGASDAAGKVHARAPKDDDHGYHALARVPLPLPSGTTPNLLLPAGAAAECGAASAVDLQTHGGESDPGRFITKRRANAEFSLLPGESDFAAEPLEATALQAQRRLSSLVLGGSHQIAWRRQSGGRICRRLGLWCRA